MPSSHSSLFQATFIRESGERANQYSLMKTGSWQLKAQNMLLDVPRAIYRLAMFRTGSTSSRPYPIRRALVALSQCGNAY
jgi:hypothetical protein